MAIDQIKTLFLDANGFGREVIITDTLFRGILGIDDAAKMPAWIGSLPKVGKLLIHLREQFARLSYVLDWRDAVCAAPELLTDVCNINNLVDYGKRLLRIRDYDLIIVAHAATGDDMKLLQRTARWFRRRRGKLVVFVGNEYDLLNEKIGFLEATGADLVCSQLPIASARYLYGDCGRTRVVEIPHALNPAVYRPLNGAPRPIDVGFIGDIYWPFIGDRERTDMIDLFRARGPELGLRCDIRTARITRAEWAVFLQSCKAIVGAESGTYYLNDRGRLLTSARDYNLNENQGATFKEVYERFFKGQPRLVSGKCISSRHFEPIGTKTCQILIEGDFNGVLKADVHYIAVKKDLSNIDDVVRRFKDEEYRREMVERTYEYVLAEHTYRHRLLKLLRELDSVPVSRRS